MAELKYEIVQHLAVIAEGSKGWCKALNLVSCARGAWLNILINLGGIADAEKAREIRAKGEGILAECESMGGDIYAAILKQTEE